MKRPGARNASARLTVIYGGARGHGRKVWGYSYAEIARAAGTSEGAVRVAVCAGKLDPANLASVIAWVNKRGGVDE